MTTHEKHQQVLPTSERSNTTTTTGSFMSIPTYLVVVDDDTYLNMPNVIQTLSQEYPAWDDAAHVVAGCMVRERIQEVNFTFPFGGWSTIFSARAIQNFIRPIYCNSSNNHVLSDFPEEIGEEHDNEFVTAACLRLSQNLIGEAALFQNGMSAADLMNAYVTHYPYLEIDQWRNRSGANATKGVGYCLHSDWLVGYFVNYYNIASRHHEDNKPDYPHNLLQGYRGSTMYTGKKTEQVKSQYKECNHDSNEKCTSSAHICHYVTPDHMRTLHHQEESKRLQATKIEK
jgi:hypothetical protein